MYMNDPVELAAERQGGRLEQVGLFGEQVPRGGVEQKVEVGRDDAHPVGFRIQPYEIAVQIRGARGVAASVGLEEASGPVVDSHTDVVQPAEEGVIGFSIESCLAGALGDRICKGCEVRQAGGVSHGDPGAGKDDQFAVAERGAKRFWKSDVRDRHGTVGSKRFMDFRGWATAMQGSGAGCQG